MSNRKRLLAIQGSFAAAHLYSQAQWDYEKNKAVFGKCFTTFGHGHEYRLRINFDVSSVADVLIFEQQARASLQKVLVLFDHKHLNFDFRFFEQKIPTTENLAILLKDICHKHFSPQLSQALKDLTIYENEFIGGKP